MLVVEGVAIVPDWRDEVISAVGAWLGTMQAGPQGPQWTHIGAAQPEGDGWYLVDLRGQQKHQTRTEELEALRLAEKRPADGSGHHVHEAVLRGEVLRVRAAPHLTRHDLRLWALKQPPTYLVEVLRDRLAALDQPGYADALAHGRLSPLPPPADVPLNPEQRQAYAACWERGLRLVWGPSGTGKTEVLRRAITDLLHAGKRVLLVSSTNIAVDNALAGVVQQLRPSPGFVVRVGTPQLSEIAANPDVALHRLKASRCQDVADQLDTVGRQLRELGSAARQLEELETVLKGYDHDAYTRAIGLLATERDIAQCTERVQQRASARDTARHTAVEAQRTLAAATAAVEEVGAARQHLAKAADLERQLRRIEGAVGELQADVLEHDASRRGIERRLNEIKSLRPMERLRLARERQRLRRELEVLTGKLGMLTAREQDAADKADRQRKLLEPDIAEHRHAAGPVDDLEIERREAALHAAREAGEQATAALAAAEEALAQARRDLRSAEAKPRPTPEQRRLIAEAERERWPQRYNELVARRRQAQGAAPEQARLEQQYEQLAEKLDKLGRNLEKAIIQDARLVATTLAKFRLDQTIYQGPYDVVLVDEVGSANVPEVLLAVSRAQDTAVLFGDFLQLGPVLNGVDRIDHPGVRRWLGRGCFAVCGITTPEEAESRARRNDGCVVLHTQYRFGDGLMDLANRVMYDGTLQRGGNLPARGDDDPEIVLLDTDGLGDHAAVRRTKKIAGWWPGGSLLAQILAEHHLNDGNATVGIITPYGPQAQASLEALRNVEGTEELYAADAGTAHRFQGREFDYVVFDLVEDQTAGGWMAQAHREGQNWHRDGARLFNVAVTRARWRLYLIGSRSAVNARARAGRGAPFKVLHGLIEDGKIRVVRATELLDPVDSVTELDPFSQQLAEEVGQYARVRRIHDERSFYAMLEGCLERAQKEVWIWAPWTAARADTVLPLLRATVERGVDVTVFTRPVGAQPQEAWRERLRELRAIVNRAVAYRNMHQKILVIDRQTTLIGSLNPLSHRDTREVMLEYEGKWLASKLLEHEHALHFATPPQCACGALAELHRSEPNKPAPSWTWRCGEGGKQRCKWTRDATPPEAAGSQQA